MSNEFGVHSEVGKLRKVIVHRPDLSLKRLTPNNHDDLLFDDVLWVERAQWEHDQFVKAMRDRGVEVYYHVDLLGEALAASEEARRNVIEMVASEYTVGWSLVDEVREFLIEDEAGYARQAPGRRLDRRRDGGRGLRPGEVQADLPWARLRWTIRATLSCLRCRTRSSSAILPAGSTTA